MKGGLEMKYFFCGLIFITFGLGISSTRMLGDIMPSGLIFTGLGLLGLFISAILREWVVESCL